jgi:hypothetical protein
VERQPGAFLAAHLGVVVPGLWAIRDAMDSVARLVVRRQGVQCPARRLPGAGLLARSLVLPQDAAELQVGAPMKQVTPRALLRLALRPSRDLLDELWSKSQVREVARRPELPWGSLQERAKPRPVLQPLLEQQELRRQASPRLLQARQALRWPASPPAS